MVTSAGKKKTTRATWTGLAIAILIGGYSLLRPAINESTGWNLPALGQQEQADTAVEAEKPTAAPRQQEQSGTSVVTGEPAAEPKHRPRTDNSLKYGLLREVGSERYLSPAGLMYTPGSAEGHRLEHLRRHVEDQPNRPGKHGVFDGGMEAALKTIDQAYENAQADRHTSKRTDRDRTIYTIDMGKRVGYVGGRDGNRDGKPMARRVRLVLEGNRVITAFPL